MGNNQKYKGVTLNRITIARLDALRHKGQSYDGIINEILEDIEAILSAKSTKKETTDTSST